jgi:fructose-1,6-bisphosphatase II
MATPGYYMEKLVVGPGAVGAIDIEQPIEKNLGSVAEALGKRVDELITIVLAKPRHGELIARIRATGAAVVEIPDGDVMGSLRALMPAGGIDLSVGVGGAPEGVVTACAVRLLGGDMQARLAPLSEAELTMIQEAGESPDRVLSLDDLVRSSDCAFVATGVTGGAILHQPRAVPGGWLTSSVLVTPGQPGAIVEAIAPTAG